MTIDSNSQGTGAFDPDETVRGDAATVPLMPVVKDEVVEAPSVALDKTVPLMQAVSERAPSADLNAIVDASVQVSQDLDAAVSRVEESTAFTHKLWEMHKQEIADYRARAVAGLKKTAAKIRDLKEDVVEKEDVIRDYDINLQRAIGGLRVLSKKMRSLRQDYTAAQDDLASLDEELSFKKAECDTLDDGLACTARELAASEGQVLLLTDNLAAKTAEYDRLKADWNICRLGKDAVIEFLRKRRPEYLARLADHSNIEVPEGQDIVTVLYNDDVVFYSALIGLFEEDTKERGALQARVESLEKDVRTAVQERDALKTKAADLEEQMAVDSKYAREKALELLEKHEAVFKYLGSLKEEE